MAAHIPLPFSTYIRRADPDLLATQSHRDSLVAAHRRLEVALNKERPRRRLTHLLCTQCGRLKPRAAFADCEPGRLTSTTARSYRGFQTRAMLRDPSERMCLACGCASQAYMRCGLCVSVRGELYFACVLCTSMVPVRNQYRGDRRGFEMVDSSVANTAFKKVCVPCAELATKRQKAWQAFRRL